MAPEYPNLRWLGAKDHQEGPIGQQVYQSSKKPRRGPFRGGEEWESAQCLFPKMLKRGVLGSGAPPSTAPYDQ